MNMMFILLKRICPKSKLIATLITIWTEFALIDTNLNLNVDANVYISAQSVLGN
jgi:hypothetical protein